MAYDPIYFENAGTIIGQANTVAAPGGNGTWTIVGETAFLFLPDSTNIEIEENGTLVGSFQTLNVEGASVSLSGVTATVDVPPQDTFSSGSGITLSGTAPDLTLNNSGVIEIVDGSLSASGAINLGTGLSLSGNTINAGSASAGITEFVQGTLTATGAATLGSGLTLSGTTNPTLTSSGGGGIVAEVGTVSGTFSTIDAGANITLSGTSPNLTISASSTASANLTFENGGTSIGMAGTLNAGSGTSLSVASGIATITASGGGGGLPLSIRSTTPETFTTVTTDTALTGFLITFPASESALVFAINVMVLLTGGPVHWNLRLDAVQFYPLPATASASMANNNSTTMDSDSQYNQIVCPGAVVNVPGDGASHTLQLFFQDSTDAGSRTFYDRLMTATQIA